MTSNAATMWVADIPAQQQAGPPAHHSIPVLLAGAGVYIATPGSSPLSMRVGKWSGWVGKHKRMQRKAPHPRIRRTRRKEGERKVRNYAMQSLVDRRFFGIFSPCFRQAKLLTLLPPSDTIAGASGDLDGQKPPAKLEQLLEVIKLASMAASTRQISLPQEIGQWAESSRGAN